MKRAGKAGNGVQLGLPFTGQDLVDHLTRHARLVRDVLQAPPAQQAANRLREEGADTSPNSPLSLGAPTLGCEHCETRLAEMQAGRPVRRGRYAVHCAGCQFALLNTGDELGRIRRDEHQVRFLAGLRGHVEALAELIVGGSGK